MRFRNGINENRESSFKAGILGFDLLTEGPIRNGQSSYLINYRYSTLGLLSAMGIHAVNAHTDNTFTNLSSKLNLPTKDHRQIWQVWGIGGWSSEQHQVIENPAEWKEMEEAIHTDFTSFMVINYTGYHFST